jgi:hypothetical protein
VPLRSAPLVLSWLAGRSTTTRHSPLIRNPDGSSIQCASSSEADRISVHQWRTLISAGGAFLSIDPHGTEALVIPRGFAAAGSQASVLGGVVQMYTAQSPAFLNGIENPKAVTAGFTGVSNPLGLSINNAFGRLWPANAPNGLYGIGTSTILDPSGAPLAGAPNPVIGGVFADNLTPRLPTQALAGALTRGAVGTAFLGRSPAVSTKAVFSVVLADGSIVQAHTLKAVDGLAPAEIVSPLLGRRWDDEDDDGRGVSARLGVILNYIPTRILYVSEPFENTITAIELSDDGVIFRVGAMRRFHSEALNHPVDLAPAVNEKTTPTVQQYHAGRRSRLLCGEPR